MEAHKEQQEKLVEELQKANSSLQQQLQDTRKAKEIADTLPEGWTVRPSASRPGEFVHHCVATATNQYHPPKEDRHNKIAKVGDTTKITWA